MDTYSQTQVVLEERLELLLNTQNSGFIPFQASSFPVQLSTSGQFKRYARRYWANQFLQNPGGFALPLEQPPGASVQADFNTIGQGALS